jgi:group I intron endonuclease
MGLAAERSYTVYMHTSPSGKKYIGITCQDVAQRWKRGGTGYKECPYFWRAIVKYGWDNFQHEVLFTGLPEAEAKQCEKVLIASYKTHDSMLGYNMTDGGDGSCGYHHSEESRARIGAAVSVVQMGRTYSEETKRKISAALTGRPGHNHTVDTRAKMSAAKMGNKHCLGRQLSDASRSAIGAAQKGRKHSEETKQKMSAAHRGRNKQTDLKIG